MDLAQYNTGNSRFGVTVPSAHSVSPAVTGNTNRSYYIIDMSESGNDYLQGIPIATTIANLKALTQMAKADGYYVIGLTCPIILIFSPDETYQILATNQALRNGSFSVDMIGDLAIAIPDARNQTFCDPTGHPNPTGHAAMAAYILAGLNGGGFQVNYTGGYNGIPQTFGAGAFLQSQSGRIFRLVVDNGGVLSVVPVLPDGTPD